jgi:hypothetical protein
MRFVWLGKNRRSGKTHSANTHHRADGADAGRKLPHEQISSTAAAERKASLGTKVPAIA